MKKNLFKILLGTIALVMVFAMAGCACIPMAAGIAAGYSAAGKQAASNQTATEDVTASSGLAVPESTATPAPEEQEATEEPAAASTEAPVYESSIVHDGTDFADMPYVAPDTDAIATAMDDLLNRIESEGGDPDAYMDDYDAVYAMYQNAETMYCIAYVLYSRDVNDEYYTGEYTRLESALNSLDVKLTDISMALLGLDEAAMTEEWGEDYVEEVQANSELTSEAVLPLLDRDTELCAEYDELTANFVYKDANG